MLACMRHLACRAGIAREAAGIALEDKWFGQQAVYRVSMGSFLFFATMSAIMVGVKYRSDSRARYLHHGNWLLKLVLWMAFTALPFLFPTSVIDVYGKRLDVLASMCACMRTSLSQL